VLLGDQCAGKSSLADSLVLGRPATRTDNDRTVGIEVRRWRLGDPSNIVANIYDAAGQRVYRATHSIFMSTGALFLHVVRCDMAEEKAVAVLLEWVEFVQQEAPGAVMGIVWTHVDRFCGSLRASVDWKKGILYVVDMTEGCDGIEMHYLHRYTASWSLKDVGVAKVDAESLAQDMAREMGDTSGAGTNAMSGVCRGNLQGKVALIDFYTWDCRTISQNIKTVLQVLVCAGALGLIVFNCDSSEGINDFHRMLSLDEIKVLFSDVASIPIMFIRRMHARALAQTGVVITAFHGANLRVVIPSVLAYLCLSLWLT